MRGTSDRKKKAVVERIRAAGERARNEAEVRRAKEQAPERPKEIGGPASPEPTRYGDWERKGRVTDF
jgi:hypothetical protein